MSACIATREVVIRAVAHLLDEGQTISIRRVRSIVGHGSHKVIASHLRAILPTGSTARSRRALLIACLRSRTVAWEQTLEALDQARAVIAQWEDWWIDLPEHLRCPLPKTPALRYRRDTTKEVDPTDQPEHSEPDIPIVIASDRPRRQTHFTEADADRLPDVNGNNQ